MPRQASQRITPPSNDGGRQVPEELTLDDDDDDDIVILSPSEHGGDSGEASGQTSQRGTGRDSHAGPSTLTRGGARVGGADSQKRAGASPVRGDEGFDRSAPTKKHKSGGVEPEPTGDDIGPRPGGKAGEGKGEAGDLVWAAPDCLLQTISCIDPGEHPLRDIVKKMPCSQCKAQEADSPTFLSTTAPDDVPDFPVDFNRPATRVDATLLKTVTADKLGPTMQRELDHANRTNAVCVS
ncbi:hypothetical protein JCM1840_000541 [Sporobolomyces johnsonii]